MPGFDAVLLRAPDRKSRYLRLDGSAGTYVSAPDSAATSITGDIDIRVKCALDDWTPAATSMLAAKGSGTQLSWTLWVDPAGTLTFQYSGDGAVPVSRVSTAATGITNGATKWVRCAVDVANSINHDVFFYLSDDGVSWSQLGTTVTNATNIALHDSTVGMFIGSRAGASLCTGNFYEFELYQGIAGTRRAWFRSAGHPPASRSVGDPHGNTWSLLAAATLV